MKKFIGLLTLVIVIGAVYFYREELTKILTTSTEKFQKPEIVVPKVNEYKTFNGNYEYVQDTNNFVPNSSQDILNIIYTTLNSGWDEFTFYCPNEYTSCIDEVINITNDNVVLSNINGFVHPYNTFKSIETSYNNSGKITLNIHKTYSDEQINILNKKIDEIYSSLINNTMSDTDKIKVIHDYIINNSKYDNDRVSGITKYNSNSAYGNLIEGYGICSGYTDSMAIFLNKMGIQNYKISSENHIWNLVYIDGKWLNLDLTFDDPVITGNTNPVQPEDVLSHDYFLIDTDTLLKLDKDEHIFDANVFSEAMTN